MRLDLIRTEIDEEYLARALEVASIEGLALMTGAMMSECSARGVYGVAELFSQLQARLSDAAHAREDLCPSS